MASNAQGSAEPRIRERNSQAGLDTSGTRTPTPAFSSGTDAPRRHRSASVTHLKEDKMLEKGEINKRTVVCAVVQSTVPTFLNILLIVSLIFGGCCANVFALEAIVSEQPDSGTLITLTQFIVCSLFTLPNFFSISAGPCNFFLKPRGIPLRSWIIFTAYFLTVNLLNNSAFSFRISVPLHIIVRSAGPVASMIIGYLYNSKRYSRMQIGSVMLLTVGVVGAALADANAKGKSISFSGGSTANGQSTLKTVIGFSILGLAMILAAFQGVFADKMYAKFGHEHWREALFYCHTLSLPFFLPALPQLIPQLRELLASPPLLDYITETTPFMKSSFSSEAPSTISHVFYSILRNSAIFPYLEPVFAHTPIKMFYLILNALTQFFCIRGVHMLAATTSSLTVVIVLNVRKLVSLMLSVYVFGNMLAPGVVAGAFTVFLAGGIYAYEGSRLKKASVRKTSVTKMSVEHKEE